MSIPFLTAYWRNLIVINYEVDPSVLRPFLPQGTEIDYFEGKALMSIIAFNFERMRFLGVVPTIPVTNFEEINLRFYVRRKVGNEIRRGVVFIREVVPSALIAAIARILYNEPYEARPMSHSFKDFHGEDGGTLLYDMRVGTRTVSVAATTEGPLHPLTAGGIEHFILEHYWGYTAQGDGRTSEYRVQHEPWRFWKTSAAAIGGDIMTLYPETFKDALEQPPHSTFVARGSPVAVYTYQRFNPVYPTGGFPRTDVKGYLLYDGRCGFCSWLVSRVQASIERDGFASAPLQSAWVGQALSFPSHQIESDIRLLLADGTLVSGADVYIYLMKRKPWLRPLGVLADLPILRWISWRCYRLVNRNRLLISRTCRLNPTPPE